MEYPILTVDAFQRDTREVDLVEINVSKCIVKIVETSDAPVLTPELLAEKATPIRYIELYYNGKRWQVGIRHGTPLSLDISLLCLKKGFEQAESTLEKKDDQETQAQHLILSRMVAEPVFSYKGEPEGAPAIEECSTSLLQSLWESHLSVNSTQTDETYQIQVRRGIPLRVSQRIHEMQQRYYPSISKKKYEDMIPSEIDQVVKSDFLHRAIFVSEMIESPSLTFDGDTTDEGYPIEQISDAFFSVIYNAQKQVNQDSEGRHQSRLGLIKRHTNRN